MSIEKIEQEMRDGLECVTGGPFDTPWRHYKTMVFAKDFDGGDSRVADIRGWGYLTGKGHGALGLDPKEAAKISDALGDFIALCSPENIRALLDELSRLREALKPFADEAKVWSEYDETENIVESWAEGPDSQLRVGHLRAAARALSEREGQE